MRKFTKISIPELELESFIQHHPSLIEDGLTYVAHQQQSNGKRLDLLLKDKNNALIVAELKKYEDDDMLLQPLDYFDYVSRHIEMLARLYKDKHVIDPTKQIRLFLVAPTFSQRLINHCRWFNLKIERFTYQCIQFEDNKEIIPVFSDSPLPDDPPPQTIYTIDEHLDYINEPLVRAQVEALLTEIKQWGNISIDPIRGAISIKVKGHVFAYLHTRRRHFILSTYSEDGMWTDYPIRTPEELLERKSLAHTAFESFQ